MLTGSVNAAGTDAPFSSVMGIDSRRYSKRDLTQSSHMRNMVSPYRSPQG